MLYVLNIFMFIIRVSGPILYSLIYSKLCFFHVYVDVGKSSTWDWLDEFMGCW